MGAKKKKDRKKKKLNVSRSILTLYLLSTFLK